MCYESYYAKLTVDDVTIVHHAHHLRARAREMATSCPLSSSCCFCHKVLLLAVVPSLTIFPSCTLEEAGGGWSPTITSKYTKQTRNEWRESEKR